MYWPESATIAAKYPNYREIIERLDRFLANNSGCIVLTSSMLLHSQSTEVQMARLMKAYVEEKVLVESMVAACPKHPDVFEGHNETLSQLYCDQCDEMIDPSQWSIGKAYMIAHRSFVFPDGEDATKRKARRFCVALSFPGEHRKYVEDIAQTLASQFGKKRVLYDKFHEAEFGRPNLDLHLQRLYSKESSLVVVFLCEAYEESQWCGMEWRSIREMIKERRDNELMFIRLDYGDVKGIFEIDGTVDALGRPSNEIASLILQRHQQVAS
ncbi:MAG: TIR domain-containing protein [Pirellula sp.]